MEHLLAFGPNHEVTINLRYVQNRLASLYSRMDRGGDARRLSDAVISGARAELVGNYGQGPAQRFLAIALAARANIERNAGDRKQACAADRRAAQQWALVRKAGAAMAADTGAGGVIASLDSATGKDCPVS